MLTFSQKHEIIRMFNKGCSISHIARELGITRYTARKYINEYKMLSDKLENEELQIEEIHEITEQMLGAPQYNGKYKERRKRKLTPEIKQRIDEILEYEERKKDLYGSNHKIRWSIKGIHELLIEEGFDIGYGTVRNYVRKRQEAVKEVYIKQVYAPGQRLEFDFGERHVMIGGKKTKVYLAIFRSAATGLIDYYVYSNKNNEAFIDAHVRFFKKFGVYEQVVYDNMKNVVKSFVGRNKRELTDPVLNLALYYGYEIVLTSPYAGNEKGSVERIEMTVIHDLFAKRDVFDSWSDLIKYVSESKQSINKGAEIKAELEQLRKDRAPFEYAKIEERKVDKYGMIREDGNNYSVPEQYIGKKVTVKKYPHTIEIFYEGRRIAGHERINT